MKMQGLWLLQYCLGWVRSHDRSLRRLPSDSTLPYGICERCTKSNVTFFTLSHLGISPLFLLFPLKFGTNVDIAKEITQMVNDIHTDEIIQEIFRSYIRLLHRLLSRQWRIRPRRRPRPFSSFIRQSHGGAFRVTRSWPSLKEEAGRRRPLQQPSFVSATLALALKRSIWKANQQQRFSVQCSEKGKERPKLVP